MSNSVSIPTNVATALYNFFDSFSIPAYVEDNIPEDASLPYITYPIVVPDQLQSTVLHARVWYRSQSAVSMLDMCDTIRSAIGSGITLSTGNGSIVIYAPNRTPFMQMQSMNDPNLKVGYLTMILHSNTR